MKRLLLAPLLIALTGCSNDLSVKTDLGEKYIVKQSAVTVFPYFDWDNRVNDLEYWIKSNRESYDSCRSREYMSDSDCSFWLDQEEDYKARLEAAKALRNEPKSLVKVKFRPIFIDLNGKKIAKDYEEIYCVNPNLSETDQAEILFASSTSVPNKYSPNAFENTKVKVCDKYAKF